MVKRKISILASAADAVAEISFFIESKRMPATAKKFADDVFLFFEQLTTSIIDHRFCNYKRWSELGYRCVNYKKKYIIAYLALGDEIIICDFVSSKLLQE